MIKDICINIKSVQNSNDNKDVTELFTFGKLLKEKNKDGYRIYYEESDAMGFDGCNITLDVTDNSVTLTRSGNAVSNLILERGKKHHCHYGTPYGEFMIGVRTDEIKNSVTDDGGDLYLKYTIDINSGFLSENEMFINIKER